jgi:predicted RNA-binding Zn-ribbon protein involved in translation (DUF1610 family)
VSNTEHVSQFFREIHPACLRCGCDLGRVAAEVSCPDCGFLAVTPGVREGVVTDPRPCLQCGYNLQGLAVSGRCPECGSEVARSLQGHLLIFAAPAFVKRLSNGANCVFAALILHAMWIGTLLLPAADLGKSGPSRIGFATLCTFASGLSLAGWWLLSSPEPAMKGRDSRIGSRKVLRAALLVGIATFVTGLVAQVTLGTTVLQSWSSTAPSIAAPVFWWSLAAYFLIWPIRTVAALQHVRSLAHRLPKSTLANRARRLIQFALAGAGVLVLVIIVIRACASAVMTDALSAACFLFPFLCGGVLALLLWWAVYASLIAELRTGLGDISRGLTRNLEQNGS